MPSLNGLDDDVTPLEERFRKVLTRADRKSQVMQCLGFCTADFCTADFCTADFCTADFCTADFWSLLAYESAEQKQTLSNLRLFISSGLNK